MEQVLPYGKSITGKQDKLFQVGSGNLHVGKLNQSFILKDPGPQPLRNPQKQGAILTLGLTRGG
jgi:hypothetical protein